MPSSLNADNGVVSGTAGLKSSADNSGVLDLQTNGTTAISISASQVVTFANQPTYTGGTANGVLYLNASKVLTSGSALVFDGTNLGIGTSSPSSGLVPGLVIGNGTDNKGITIFGSTTTQSNIAFTDTANTQQGLIQYDHGGDYMRFFTASSERARIDSSGNLMVNQTSATGKMSVTGTGSGNLGILAINATDTSGSFVWAQQAFLAGQTSGQNFVNFIGKEGSTRNAAYIGYKFSSAGSTSNLLTFGHFGADNLMNLDGSGNLLVGTTTAPSSSGMALGQVGTVRALQGGMTNTNWRIRERVNVDYVALTTNITDGGTQDNAAKSSWQMGMGYGNVIDNWAVYRAPAGSSSFTSLMTIDSAGRVTTPYQPGFRAGKSSAAATVATGAPFQFNTTANGGKFNTGSSYNTANGTFTCPISGVYYFHCEVILEGVSNNTDLSDLLHIQVNGTLVAYSEKRAWYVANTTGSGAYYVDNVSAVLSLVAGDAVRITNGSGVTVTQHSNSNYCIFEGYLLG
jgi:hypothetical protein